MLKREELSDERIEQIVQEARAAGYHFFLSAEARAASLKEALARYAPGDEAWVFAYGSLMWNPALDFADALPCRVEGWHRSFCFWIPLGRGTPELPGLMLALERGGACEGIAYRLRPDRMESGLAILWNREMLAGIYRPQWVPTTLRDGRTVTAVTFEVDPGHCQYCGDLPIEKQAYHGLRRRPARQQPRLSRQHRGPCAGARNPRSLHRGHGRAGGAPARRRRGAVGAAAGGRLGPAEVFRWGRVTPVTRDAVRLHRGRRATGVARPQRRYPDSRKSHGGRMCGGAVAMT